MLYGTAATAALLAVAVVGDGWAPTYALALAAFWWLLPTPVLLARALLRGRRRAVVALTAPVAVLAATWGHVVVPGSSSAQPDLRVATYNATHGGSVDGVLQLVADDAPDVLLLQELTPRQRGAVDRHLAATHPYRSFAPLGPQDDGDAVVSRYPVISATPVSGLPVGARPTDLVRLDLGERTASVLSVHLASPCLGCSASGDASNPAGSTASAGAVRVAEARRFAEVAQERRRAGDVVVVGGDVNSAELNEPLQVLGAAGLTDVNAAVGRMPQLTRGPGPGLARVDVVLVAGLEPVRTWEGERGPSTHSPVVADLALTGAAPGARMAACRSSTRT